MAIADDVIWHQIHLDRYKQGVQNKMLRSLTESKQSVLKRLRTLKGKIESGNSKAYWTKTQLEQQLKQIDSLIKKNYAELNKMLEKSNLELTHNEIKWNVKNIGGYVGAGATVAAPTASAVFASVVEHPFEGWVNSNGAMTYVHDSPLRNVPKKHMKEMENIVKDAFITGRTTTETKAAVSAVNRAISRTNKLYDVSRRNITAETRTALQTYANRAREETYLANADLFPWVEYLATLDSRTTEICASLDGRVYKVEDQTRPSIPQHWNCRSSYIPKKTKDEDVGIERPTVEPTKEYKRGDNKTKKGKVRKATKANKAVSRDTQPGGTKFNDWLKKQDAKNPDYVRDYFKSDKRYQAWKAGKLGKVKYTSVDGRTYNIKSLNATKSGPVLRQFAQQTPVTKAGVSVKGMKLVKAVKANGKRVGGVWEDGGRYFAKHKGRSMGYFDNIDEAEIAALTGKRAGPITPPKPPRPKPPNKKVVARKKKVVKPKPGQKLLKKVTNDKGNRIGGVYQVTDESGNVYFRAKKSGKFLDGRYATADEAEAAIRAGRRAAKEAPTKKATIPDSIKGDERKIWSEIPGDLMDKIDRYAASAKEYQKATKDYVQARSQKAYVNDVQTNNLPYLEDKAAKIGRENTKFKVELQKAYDDLFKDKPSKEQIDAIVNKLNFYEIPSNRHKRMAVKNVRAFLEVSNGHIPSNLRKFIRDDPRAYAQSYFGLINVGGANARTIFHEIGHFVEYSDLTVNNAALTFLKRRRTSNAAKRLRDLTKQNYDIDEIAYEDKFIDPYVGKKYRSKYVPNTGNNITPTEVISMGIEKFSDRHTAMQFLQQDPEHFKLALGVLLKIRKKGIL